MADVVEKILEDHSEIKGAYAQIKMTAGDEADKWFNQLLWKIAVHSAAEEIDVYPMFEKLGPEGKALADKSRADHLKTKKALEHLDGKKISKDETVRLQIDQMMTDLLEHISMEEGPDGDLALLRSRFTPDELRDAGKAFGRSRKMVPTHPHPGAPDKPPFETVAGMLAAPIDKIRDLFRSFPEETKHQH